jgi:WD40 repeat protein
MWEKLALTSLLIFTPLVALCTEVPTEPILRIETGMHTAAIRMTATDAAGRYFVTGSDDKTVRIWDLVTGKLLRTLRPPIGLGEDGKIWAVAVTPEGDMIAASVVGVSGNDTNSIYLFDRTTGRLVRRIGGLPGYGFHLAFSRDGQRLAVSLQGANGIRVFRVADGQEIARDSRYTDGSYGLDWDSSGRLVASSDDGSIVLYGDDFKILARITAPGGKNPHDVVFSPDGQKVACGYVDSPRVDVLSGVDLHLLYQPNTKDASIDCLPRVAWSSDGQILYAAGNHYNSKQQLIRRWTDEGRGSFSDIWPGAKNLILDLKSVSGGRLAFGSADPKWGVLSAAGYRELLIEAATIETQNLNNVLRIDSSGNNIHFIYQARGNYTADFSVPARILALDPAENELLKAPHTEVPGLKITDRFGTSPKVNGTALKLNAHEALYGLDIATDGQSFVLGTDWYIRSFDRAGMERWNAATPAAVWAVNLSSDGRLVVAALGDGTIRWYRADNGSELLVFFPHADRKRWVAWTPSGYYDASVGGEELIGWHVNRGLDQAADFFPASRFRDSFYRPDVVSRVLDTLDEARALAQADAETRHKTETTTLTKLLPPVVTIVGPAAETEIREASVPFHVKVRSPSGEPITAVRAYVDGRPAASARGLVYEPDAQAADPSAEREYTFIVPIPPRDCTVAIAAETRLATSEPVAAKIRWAAVSPAIEKPKLYLLAVGVGTYANPAFKLDLPAKDARDVAASWKAQKGGLYRDVEVKLLTDAQATKDAILDGLEWLERQTTEKDVAILYFSGHGFNDPRSGEYLFLPYDADLDSRRKTLLPNREVQSVLSTIPGKVLLFLDTCHSGNLLGAAKARDATDLTRLLNELTSAENGVVVFSASTGRQQAIESPEWKNGAFTRALLEALSGKANYRDNSLYVTELESYLDRRVKELTKGLQTPVARRPDAISDFPVAVVVVPK